MVATNFLSAPGFVFRFGPLADVQPETWVYCLTGDGPNGLVAALDATTDQVGVERALSHAAGPTPLDSELARTALMLGVPFRDPSRDVAEIMLWMAHMNVLGQDQALALLERSNLALLRTCARLDLAAALPAEPIAIQITGDSNLKHFSDVSYAFGVETVSGDRAFVVTPNREHIEPITDRIRRGAGNALAELDLIAAVLMRGDAQQASIRMFSRLIGLDAAPALFRAHGGTLCRLSDEDVLTLGAAVDLLGAVSRGAPATGRCEHGRMSVEVKPAG